MSFAEVIFIRDRLGVGAEALLGSEWQWNSCAIGVDGFAAQEAFEAAVKVWLVAPAEGGEEKCVGDLGAQDGPPVEGKSMWLELVSSHER